jgi:transposase
MPQPPGYRQGIARPKPMLGQFLPVIDEILESDKTAPPKQRHTAKRIYERLRDEYGYTGCSSQVRRAVSRSKHYSKEVFVPLSHPPGHAQFDFGEATVVIAGVEVKAALAVMTLPYSDAYFVSAYPRECTETFQAGHVAAFEFFGGVPVRTSYDNTSIAVKKVVGRERELTTEFLAAREPLPLRPPLLPGGAGQREGPRRDPRGLLEAEPAGACAALLLFLRDERVPRRVLLCRSVPPGPGKARDKGRAPRG